MLKALRNKKADLVAKANKLLSDGQTNADGLLTAEQQTQYDAYMADLARVNKQIEGAEALAEIERTSPAAAIVTDATDSDKDKVKGTGAQVTDRAALQPFASFGEQLKAVMAAASPERVIDPRLQTGAVAGSSEKVASDGGFLVQQDFSSEILGRVYENGAITSRVRRVPISAGSNGLKVNAIKETSRANGSRFGGITMGWEGEGDSATASKPKFRQIDLKLNKLIGLMYATDELLEDAVAFNSIATQAFSDETEFMVEAGIFEGTGNGQPLGVSNSPALIAVAKEAGQAAGTIVAENIIKMWSRCWGRSRRNAVWLINQDIEPALFSLSLAVGTGGIPLYQPANGLADAPFSTLMGRPVIPIEHAATLGTQGDIGLYDFSQYLMIDKGAPKQAVSIHVRFIYDESAFRITYRCDGQPIWESPLTPKKGSNTLSPFVQLATRS